jgi:hypothetical protein
MKKVILAVLMTAVLFWGLSTGLVFAQYEVMEMAQDKNGDEQALYLTATTCPDGSRCFTLVPGKTFYIPFRKSGPIVGVNYREDKAETGRMVLCLQDGSLIPWVYGESIQPADISKAVKMYETEGPFTCAVPGKPAIRNSDGLEACSKRIPKVVKRPKVYFSK